MRKILIANKEATLREFSEFVINTNDILTGIIQEQMFIGRFIVVDVKDLDVFKMQLLIAYINRNKYELYCFKELENNEYIKSISIDQVNFIETNKEIEDTPLDLSKYKGVLHIGDIHGSYSVLMKMWNRIYNPDFFYIFLGDLINRGKQSAEVMSFIFSIYKQDNVLILKGNHDEFLLHWTTNERKPYSKYSEETATQFQKRGICKIKSKDVYNNMKDCVFYKYNEKIIFASHAGLNHYPQKKYLVNSFDYICGRNDFKEIDRLFSESIKDDENIYQVHGHSNFLNIKSDKYKNSFNLEGGVEYGGKLRTVLLVEDGFKFYYDKNKDTVMKNFLNNI